jgi:hypothetical protein
MGNFPTRLQQVFWTAGLTLPVTGHYCISGCRSGGDRVGLHLLLRLQWTLPAAKGLVAEDARRAFIMTLNHPSTNPETKGTWGRGCFGQIDMYVDFCRTNSFP